MRNNQASLLYNISIATVKLVEKLAERIEYIDAEEIRVTDIPKFISALSNFIGIAADAEARILSISGLLAVLEDQIDRKIFQDNLFYIGHVQHKSQASINAEEE